jgi:signal recognition particle subunit SRP54
MTGSRRQRIAAGSGSTIQDVNQFMKQFEEMRKMMKMMNKMGGGAKAARALGGMMGKR